MDSINITPIVLGIIGLGFYLNFYKYATIIDCINSDSAYGIYPWSENPVTSNSSPVWLIIHLTNALGLLLLSGRKVLNPNWFREAHMLIIFAFLHYFFTMHVFINAQNFNDLPYYVAIIFNMTLLIAMNWLHHSTWEYAPLAYFFIVAIPVLLEATKYFFY